MSAIITIEHDGQTQTISESGLESLNDDILRITDVFFAKKKVTQNGKNLDITFERINETILGREIYLIIKTNNMRGLEIEAQIKPVDTTLTGSTDALSLLQGAQQATQFTAQVGDFAALNNTQDSHDHYTNLATLQDYAILKLSLRPQAKSNFENWATNIGTGSAALQVDVKRKDNQAFADRDNAEEQSEPVTFLQDTPLTLLNKIVYEIYHTDNEYNSLEMIGDNRKQIGKIANPAIQDVVYYYHSSIDNEVEIAASTISTVEGRSNGNKHIEKLPAGFTHSAPAEGGEARTNYYYDNGTIITEGVHKGSKYISYALEGTQVQLIRMPDSLNRTIDGVLLAYSFSSSQRRYCHPDCFAGFMVALSTAGVAVQSTGMCFSDATSYPSVSHPNGDSIDTLYLTNRANAQKVLTAFVNAGFSQVIAGTDYRWLIGAHLYKKDHNNHLHSGNFSANFVQILNN